MKNITSKLAFVLSCLMAIIIPAFPQTVTGTVLPYANGYVYAKQVESGVVSPIVPISISGFFSMTLIPNREYMIYVNSIQGSVYASFSVDFAANPSSGFVDITASLFAEMPEPSPTQFPALAVLTRFINIANLQYNWPVAQTSGCIFNDGSGNLSFVACSGGGGAGVTSIDTLTGAFTFSGSGVSHTGNAYTFSGGGIPYPTGTGIAVVSSSTAWGTTLVAPSGTIVGTTDTQTLTSKTVDGVSPTTFGFLDATSSIQTQLNAKAPLASPTFTGTVTVPSGAALGTPASVTLTNATGMPLAGVTGNLPNANLASQTANTVLGSLTATTPSGLTMPSCSTAGSSALIWTTGTGFGCNTISGGGGFAGSVTVGTIPIGVTNTTTLGNSLLTFASNTLTLNSSATGGIVATKFTSNDTSGAGFGFIGNEGTATTGVSAQDAIWADSTAHRWKANNNNGGAVQFMYSSDVLLSAQMPAFTGAVTNSGLAMSLATKYITPCSGGWEGANSTTAIGAGPYSQLNCRALAAATITGVVCYSDNTGTTTLNISLSGTSILTGAVTCTPAGATATLSGTPTMTLGQILVATAVADASTERIYYELSWTY